MKPIVVKPENATRLQAAITAAADKTEERTVSAEDLIRITAEVDAKLAVIEGTTVTLDLHPTLDLHLQEERK